MKVLLITFTRNSEKLIEGLFRNVDGVVDEVVVVDGCSSDRTLEIAKAMVLRFIFENRGGTLN